jgi:hypothetical protein
MCSWLKRLAESVAEQVAGDDDRAFHVLLHRAGASSTQPDQTLSSTSSVTAMQGPTTSQGPDSVRVVSIVWNQPAEGDSQQALKVISLSRPVTMPARVTQKLLYELATSAQSRSTPKPTRSV